MRLIAHLLTVLCALAYLSGLVLPFFAPETSITIALIATWVFYIGYGMYLTTTIPVNDYKGRHNTPEFAVHACPFLIHLCVHTLAYMAVMGVVACYWRGALIPLLTSLVPLGVFVAMLVNMVQHHPLTIARKKLARKQG